MKRTLQRTQRYAKVAGAAARVGGSFLAAKVTGKESQEGQAALLRAALGGLKGPLMKAAQLLAALPDFLPPAYAAELATLQAQAPAMGWPFVRRRMAAELGVDWQARFASFEKTAAAAASLGQVHRAVAKDGRALACKLQYPDMDTVLEADLRQLGLALAMFEKLDGSVATDAALTEIGERLREELDYAREAAHLRLYRKMLEGEKSIHVPAPAPALCTPRLLTMDWLEGAPLFEAASALSQEERNALAVTLFRAWYLPFYRYGVLHGDPHPGNITLRPDGGINLLDFGCVRVFEPQTVQAVVTLFHALQKNDRELTLEGYRLWGFESPSEELVETLNIWARFIYAPFLEDRVQALAETNATREGIGTLERLRHALRAQGKLALPRAFVMIDRASIGLGGAFLRLGAQVNWHRELCALTQGFDPARVGKRQKEALKEVGL